MPVEIDLGTELPAGHAAESIKVEEGDEVELIVCEFTSTEDGQHFIQRLEATPDDILTRLPNRVPPSQVDSMLAIIHADGKTTVYVNEMVLRLVVSARTARHFRAGMPVSKDDVADVERLEIGLTIPADAGFLFLFSVGWRKGLFYDYGPLLKPHAQLRPYDVPSVLGQAFCHVLFQNRFSISDDEWEALFQAKWFPFIGLPDRLIDDLIQQVRSGWHPDEKLEEVVGEVRAGVSGMLESWSGHSSFRPHLDIVKHAVDRFLDGDYMSCTALLYPRIEGIMRTNHGVIGTNKRASPDNLTASAVSTKSDKSRSLFLPHRFEAYLRDVYYADFEPRAVDIGVSRHSVAHGVASAREFDRKSAVISILIVHQLFFSLKNVTAAADVDGDVESA